MRLSFRKTLIAGLATGVAAVFSACVTPVNISEALQLPESAKLYTSYNIWYEIPWNISSLNYQRGKMIPVGTEIKLLGADSSKIQFQVLSTGNSYTIEYHEKWAMKPVEEFLKEFVTTKDRSEQTEGISPEVRKNILNGIVEKGMTRNEVEMAFGPPSPHRTPSKDLSTWIYWDSRFVTKRVIFKGDKVLEVLR
ncbi:MAG: hypothetical protein JW808_04740 [Victivallales bacterium]|nr:hypothetical protein [Victivallales bacterium]